MTIFNTLLRKYDTASPPAITVASYRNPLPSFFSETSLSSPELCLVMNCIVNEKDTDGTSVGEDGEELELSYV